MHCGGVLKFLLFITCLTGAHGHGYLSVSCPEGTGGPTPDGDCWCQDGGPLPDSGVCFENGIRGCTFSQTAEHGIKNDHLFLPSCSGCKCGSFQPSPVPSPPTPAPSCPEGTGGPTPDGDCWCQGGKKCYEDGSLGCTFSQTAEQGIKNENLFLPSCDACECLAPTTPAPTTPAPTTPAPTTRAPTPAPAPCPNGWGQQCGGQGFTGSTCCQPGFVCQVSGPWWAQCSPSKVLLAAAEAQMPQCRVRCRS